MSQQRTDFEGMQLDTTDPSPIEVYPSTIIKEIRSWAITLLLLGGVSIFASDYLNASWGIMLLLVGLASFFFRSSAMMVIYAVTLIRAGISNATSGEIIWLVFAIIQWFMAFRVFKTFFRFQKAELNLIRQNFDLGELTPKRSKSVFPWAAGVLGIFSIVALPGFFIILYILTSITTIQTNTNLLDLIESLIVNMGILGFSLGLASVLCKYPRKAVSIIGMVTGLLTTLIELTLLVLYSLSIGIL